MLSIESQIRNRWFPWLGIPWARRPRVLVASVPRCGSTYLFRSIANLPDGRTFPRTSQCRFVRDPQVLPDEPYLKTHGLAPASVPDDVCVLFVFGDPIHAVVSTRQRRFTRGHFRNCGYRSRQTPDIYARDDLGYEQIFDSWMKPHRYPVLALRYERLHEHQQELKRFLGRPIRLPKQRSRSTRVPDGLRRRLMPVYGRFVDKVDRSPDASMLGPVDG